MTRPTSPIPDRAGTPGAVPPTELATSGNTPSGAPGSRRKMLTLPQRSVSPMTVQTRPR